MNLKLMLIGGSVIIVGVAGITQTRTSLNELKAERRHLLQEQADLEESLTILRAEYAHLSSPQRLAQLAKQQGLQPLKPNQLKRWHHYPAEEAVQ